MDPIHILIVDDEGQFVDAVVERLRLRGFNADGVTSGRDAMELLHQKSYDVVLLDVKMPGLGGGGGHQKDQSRVARLAGGDAHWPRVITGRG